MGRVIAVDWALSKERWEEAKVKMEVDEDMERARVTLRMAGMV